MVRCNSARRGCGPGRGAHSPCSASAHPVSPPGGASDGGRLPPASGAGGGASAAAGGAGAVTRAGGGQAPGPGAPLAVALRVVWPDGLASFRIPVPVLGSLILGTVVWAVPFFVSVVGMFRSGNKVRCNFYTNRVTCAFTACATSGVQLYLGRSIRIVSMGRTRVEFVVLYVRLNLNPNASKVLRFRPDLSNCTYLA
ncbi:unnamed protein product [Pieris brassicae]|uniref:Uncharacterized protein n=1 Tax=Pieris brassicae TaxID=7116 RepID=A0A9P0WT53_PIEBR|nr:unnamed protein product [Pieris brassicae]